jgi:hypothetical protein
MGPESAGCHGDQQEQSADGDPLILHEQVLSGGDEGDKGLTENGKAPVAGGFP